MSSMRFQLLGIPCVVSDVGEVPLSASRPMQLLAHLAVHGDWQSRDELARLFWPDRENKIARSNLRNLLCKTAAAAPYAPIETTEHALRLNAPSDLGEFDAVVQRGDWEAAVHIGARELLQGFESHATEPYQLWLQGERDASLARWRSAVRALLAQPTRPLAQREALAQGWAQRCPLDEDAVHARVALAFERQQVAAARKIYHDFEARLRAEFDVRPSQALARFALQSAPAEQPVNAATPAAKRPLRLFGRRLELQQLQAMMANDTVRLVTITGPGGVGKSTLMRALFEQCSARDAAVAYLVDAHTAPRAQAVVAAIAAALGVEGMQGADNDQALASALRERRCLLMIDGAEQADLARPLALLLDRCPNLRLVVASRQRLQLDSEHVFTLDGFPLPDADEGDPTPLSHNDGFRYFADNMAQAGTVPDLARDGRPIAALVRAVDGLPLALKLLARLTPVLSLSQLLEHMQHHVAGAALADAPGLRELLPSLTASFQRSWSTLSPPEQAVLARLAVFPSAFEIDAARVVGQTELPLITALVDRSLLRASGSGRLSLHAAIRACVLAECPLTPDTVNAYVGFYARRLNSLAGQARYRAVKPLRQFLRSDGAHVEHAWQLAAQHRDYGALMTLAESLWFVADGLSGTVDCAAGFVQAEQQLRDDPQAPVALKALLLAGAARAAWDQGHGDLAADRARAALRAAQQARHRIATFHALATLIKGCLVQRRLKEAQALLGRAEALLGPTGDDDLRARVFSSRGLLCYFLGDLEGCLQSLDKAAEIGRRLEDSDAVVRTLLDKAFFSYLLKAVPQALQLMQHAIQEAQAREVSPALAATALSDLAYWQRDLGQLPQARASIDRALAIAQTCPHPVTLHLRLQTVHAAITLDEGNAAGAAPMLVEVLAAIGAGDVPPLAGGALLLTAKWFAAVDDRAACVATLNAVRNNGFGPRFFDAAQAMLRDMGEAPHLPASTDGADPLPDDARSARTASQGVLRWLAQRRHGRTPQ